MLTKTNNFFFLLLLLLFLIFQTTLACDNYDLTAQSKFADCTTPAVFDYTFTPALDYSTQACPMTCSVCSILPSGISVAFDNTLGKATVSFLPPTCKSSFAFNVTCSPNAFNSNPCDPSNTFATKALYSVTLNDNCLCVADPPAPVSVAITQNCQTLQASWPASTSVCDNATSLTYIVNVYEHVGLTMTSLTGDISIPSGFFSYTYAGPTAIQNGHNYSIQVATVDSCGASTPYHSSSIITFKSCVCGDGFLDFNEVCDAPSNPCCSATCQIATSSQVCRENAGSCDIPEYCSGVDLVCPLDLFQPSSLECSPSANNGCVDASHCTGNSASCPAGAFHPGACYFVPGNKCYSGTCDVALGCTNQTLNDCSISETTCMPQECNVSTGICYNTAPPDCSYLQIDNCRTVDCNDPSGCSFALNPFNASTCASNSAIYAGQCYVGDVCGSNNNIGPCHNGHLACVGSDIECQGAVFPVAEICNNGIDDDCNGIVDNGCNEICVVASECTSGVDQCHSAQCVNNACVYPVLENQVCVPSNLCVDSPVCNALGACEGTSKICPGSNDQCMLSNCDSVTGNCLEPTLLYGDVCSNGNYCDFLVHCYNGTCSDVITSITFPPSPDGCIVYECSNTEPHQVAVYTTSICNDNNACTFNDVCGLGACAGVQNWTPDNLICTEQSCDTGTGAVTTTLLPGYVLIGGVSCILDGTISPENPCLYANSTLSTSQWVAFPETTLCNDGLFCTANEFCNAAAECVSNTPVMPLYNSSEPCIEHVCDEPLSQLQNALVYTIVPVTHIVACPDNNVCNGDEMCGLGTCNPGTPISCDNIPVSMCYINECSPLIGCIQTFNTGAVCDDQNPCTIDDVCTNPSQICAGTPVTGTPCNTASPSSGECSLAEGDMCVDGACVDQYDPLGTPCGPYPEPLYADCSQRATCTGESDVCPLITQSLPGTPCTSDGIACTTDECDGNSLCIHSTTACECDEFRPCFGSHPPCTRQDCVNGTCSEDIILPGYCLIDSVCYSDGYTETCRHCDAQITPTAWAISPNGLSCVGASPDTECAHFECQSGLCDLQYSSTSQVCGVHSGSECDPLTRCDGLGQCETFNLALYEGDLCVSPTPIPACAHMECNALGECSTLITSSCQCLVDATCDILANFTTQEEHNCFYSVCNTSTLSCTSITQHDNRCFIDGVCYYNTDPNPLSECQYCNTAVSLTTWSNATDGTGCGEYNPNCGLQNSCESGICQVNGPHSNCSAYGEAFPCRSYSCNTVTGLCVYDAIHNGEELPEIQDGSYCNGMEQCLNGEIVTVAWPPLDISMLPCVEQVCSEITHSIYYVNTTNMCDDGNACTMDVCVEGECLSNLAIHCSGERKCFSSECNTQTGLCGWVPLAAGSLALPNDNLCNGIETCDGLGNVVLGEHLCCGDDNPCTDKHCDPVLGCIVTVDTNNVCKQNFACFDSSVCNVHGKCVPSQPTNCSEIEALVNNPCQYAVCNPLIDGCQMLHHPDYTENCPQLTPDNICDGRQVCMAGHCATIDVLNCNDGNVCTSTTCDPLHGCAPIPDNIGMSCNSPDACMYEAVCNATGECVGQIFDCSFMDTACTVGVCHSIEGILSCVRENKPNGTSCADSDPCNGEEVCIEGSCNAPCPLDCIQDVDPCHSAECIEGVGCAPNPDFSCDDGLWCTIDDICSVDGQCLPGVPRTPDLDCPFSPCIYYECVELGNNTGAFVSHFLPSGTSCGDNNLCNGLEVCSAHGQCLPGEPLLCPVANNNVCVHSECFPLLGCVYSNVSVETTCNDFLFCTYEDHCNGMGDCTGTPVPPTWCANWDDECAKGECSEDPLLPNWYAGCYSDYTNYPDSTECGNQNACVGNVQQCVDHACTDVSNTQYTYCVSTDECIVLECVDPAGIVPPHCDSTLLTGTSCFAGDLCYQQGLCVAGACQNGPPIVCPAPVEPQCQQSACDAGNCFFTNSTLGTNCSDSNYCTVGDACSVDGHCVPGVHIICEQRPCHSVVEDDLNPACCVYTYLGDNTTCNDNQYCTEGDYCWCGECLPGPNTTSCDYILDNLTPAEKECLVAFCDEVGESCLVDHVADNTPCGQYVNGYCGVQPYCLGGQCIIPSGITCDDGNPCTDDHCGENGVCYNIPNTTNTCSDGNACTSNYCSTEGHCISTNIVCAVSEPQCQSSTCDTQIGCVYTNFVNTTSCNADNSVCTPNDLCNGEGHCVVDSSQLVCDTSNPCKSVVCDPVLGCVYTDLANGTSCSDGLFCNGQETCMMGQCAAGTAPNCVQFSTDCSTGFCNETASSCDLVSANENGICTSFDQCVSEAHCLDSHCLPVSYVVCEDNNMCTENTCNPQVGCVYNNLTGPADDLIFCNGPDQCVNGELVSGPTPICPIDPLHLCRYPVCLAIEDVCGFIVLPDGAICNQTSIDVCSVHSTCLAGQCEVVESIDCNDGNPCTEDYCDREIGCYHYNTTNSCDDLNPCTTCDTCVMETSECVGVPKNCSYLDTECVQGVCNPQNNGACEAVPRGDGRRCDDGRDCTCVDTCLQGECVGLSFLPGTCLSPSDTCSIIDACGVCGGNNSTCSLQPISRRSILPVDSLSIEQEIKCFNGIVVSERCMCQRGWTGEACSECALIGDTENTRFLCVPISSESKEYALREISNANIDVFLNGLVSNVPGKSVYPGSQNLDCLCNMKTDNVVVSMDKNAQLFAIETQYRLNLQRDDMILEMCQLNSYEQAPEIIDSENTKSNRDLLLHDDDEDEDILEPHHFKVAFFTVFIILIVVLFIFGIYAFKTMKSSRSPKSRKTLPSQAPIETEVISASSSFLSKRNPFTSF